MKRGVYGWTVEQGVMESEHHEPGSPAAWAAYASASATYRRMDSTDEMTCLFC